MLRKKSHLSKNAPLSSLGSQNAEIDVDAKYEILKTSSSAYSLILSKCWPILKLYHQYQQRLISILSQ